MKVLSNGSVVFTMEEIEAAACEKVTKENGMWVFVRRCDYCGKWFEGTGVCDACLEEAETRHRYESGSIVKVF